MLTGSASLLQQQAGSMRNVGHGVPMQALDDRFSQLTRTFELASGETTVIAYAMLVSASLQQTVPRVKSTP